MPPCKRHLVDNPNKKGQTSKVAIDSPASASTEYKTIFSDLVNLVCLPDLKASAIQCSSSDLNRFRLLNDGRLLHWLESSDVDLNLFRQHWTFEKPVLVSKVFSVDDPPISVARSKELIKQLPFADYVTPAGLRNVFRSMAAFHRKFPLPKFVMTRSQQFKLNMPYDLGRRFNELRTLLTNEPIEYMDAKTKLVVNSLDVLQLLVCANTPDTQGDTGEDSQSSHQQQQSAKSVRDQLENLCADELDAFTLDRLRQQDDRSIGAVWFIFDPSDADKIRHFVKQQVPGAPDRNPERALTSSSLAGSFPYRGATCCQACRENTILDPLFDPVLHLNVDQRAQLKREYGVQCCTVVQCEGEVVLVPAGSPYQVHSFKHSIQFEVNFLSSMHLNRFFRICQELRLTNFGRAIHRPMPQSGASVFCSIANALDRLLLSK